MANFFVPFLIYFHSRLQLFPSGVNTADHLPPSQPVSCLLCFYNNYFNALFNNIHKSSLRSYTPFLLACSSNILSPIYPLSLLSTFC